MNFLFRCDGSVEVGMGHIVRCLALADELRSRWECEVTFAMRKSILGIAKVRQSYSVIQSEETNGIFDYTNWLAECIQETSADMLFLDVRDELTYDLIKDLKATLGIAITTIDDTEDKRQAADLAFYPPVPQVTEYDWNNFNGNLYSGWEYVIIRDCFFKDYARTKRSHPKILIMMGGSDPYDMTGFAVDCLNSIELSFSASIILGPGYSFTDHLMKNLSGVQFDYDIYQNPENISRIMADSDFSIMSFGVTAYELAALGVPMIILSITEDHFKSASIFSNAGIGISLGIYKDISESELERATIKLLSESKHRKKMSNRARALFQARNLGQISDTIFQQVVK
jgi:spore coat polysaccharide biosynthesis predicted glycosyltransferase SpsG